MMVGGFAAAMPYSMINQVTSDFVKHSVVNTRQGKMRIKEAPEKWYTQIVGLFAGISVCYAGNMHYTIVKHLAINIPWLKKLLSIERDRYWFPDATRYIGYTPDTDDKTIHEFPSYSFVLGDLHAHVVNIMFVLTVMAVLYTILQVRRARMDSYRYEGFSSIKGYDIKSSEDRKELILKEILTPQIFVLGFFVGLFHMTNFWDFPIYFVVSGAIILFSNAVICKFKPVALILTAAHAVVILVVSAIVSLPFTLSFDQISTGIALCVHHTPIYQLLVLWGLPITVVITFLVAMIKRLNKSLGKRYKSAADKKKKNINRESISKFCDDHPGFDWLYRMINSLEISDLFIMTLGLCAIGLILMPELVYVKDIYSGSYKRANTMFKLTYQAFIMFGMCMPYIIARFLRFADHKRQIVFGGITLFLLITTFGYYFDATESWFGKYNDHNNYKGLDCTAFVKDYYPEDERATEWINTNIEGPVHILEGVGYSYTYYGRIAVLTGSTTPIGWETHEWLWRSSANFAKPEIITERQKDVKAIYTSESKEEVEELIAKYDLDYIIVGVAERYDGMRKGEANEEGFVRNSADNYWYKTQEVNDDLLRSLGEIVYQDKDENGSVFRPDGTYMTYIVKVKK
jgi:YYY domain-containing protein